MSRLPTRRRIRSILGRGVEHVGQQPPGQRPAAGELAGRGGDELLELDLVPILFRVAALGPLPLQVLFRLQQARILGVGGNLVEALAPAGDPHVVLVGQDVDVALLVELRAPGAAENLVGRAGLQQFLFLRWSLHDAGQHHAACRQVDARRKRLGAHGDGEEFVLEEFLDDPPVLGQQAGVMDPHAAQEDLPQFRPRPLAPVVTRELFDEPGLLAFAEDLLALDLLGQRPALLAVEAEDQGGGPPRLVVAGGHFFEVLAQQHVAHPMETQRHLAFLALDQFELALVAVAEPVDEFHGVAHGGREQEGADLRRQQAQREFPDHAALGIGEAVKLVHHHGADLAEVEGLAVQQAVQQDFGHDDQDAGVGVLAAIAGHQADVVGMETPAGRGRLHLAELLLRQGDQRRGVVGRGAGVQGLEQRGLGDQRLARPRGRADQHALRGRKPGQQGLFLDRVGLIGKLIEVPRGQFVAREGHGVRIKDEG